MFNKDDLGRLVAVDTAPAVSVFLPTHVAGREIRQDTIRLKNLLGDAVERLTAQGLRRPDAEALIAPALRLLDDAAFWRHQNEGLALFIAQDLFEAHRVPIGLPEEVVVSQNLAVRPLLPLLAADGSFMVLTATASGARLYSATRHGLCEEQADLPAGVEDVDAETDYDKNVLNSPGHMRHHDRRNVAVNSVKTHNFGESPEELRHAHLVEYLRRLADAVQRHLDRVGFKGPLVLVAEPEVQGQFRKLVRHPASLLPAGVDANPDALKAEEIHDRAFRLVEPLFDQGRRDAVDRFRAVAGDPQERTRAVTRPEEIVAAAGEGRIDALLLVEGTRLWGRYDETTRRVTATGSPDGQSVDLLEKAAADTLLHGGAVHVVARADLPPEAIVGAILRY
ncbi:baeRF3 domain-containing protein [Azospirillum sp. ST 5-10]|uniref:baeRF3 domain-containing protein n=1 Tax=unclassified Azospirillum TaxID=2630922 RepID=UPI003F49E06A